MTAARLYFLSVRLADGSTARLAVANSKARVVLADKSTAFLAVTA